MTNPGGELERIARRYRSFAVDEARGQSEIYERLALAVAAPRIAPPASGADEAPVFPCKVRGAVPLPARVPQSYRAGARSIGKPAAWTRPHGQSIEWIGEPP
jgi:hypothetical protein